MQTHLLTRSLLSATFLVLTFSVATAPPAASEQPSLAVLPFTNLSGDAAQDYLSEVVTDNTVKILSKVGGLLVVAGWLALRRPGQASARDRQRAGRALCLARRRAAVRRSRPHDRHPQRCRRATRPCGPKTTSAS